MRIVLLKVSKFSWWLLLTLIIVAGLLVTFAQIASPYLSSFRPDIEKQLGELIGSKVEIGDIKAHWKGLGPALKLQNIRVSERSNQDGYLLLEQIEVDLDLLEMFRNGVPAPGKLWVKGIRLEIERDANSKLHFKGFAETGDTVNKDIDNSFNLQPLLMIPDLYLTDTRISWTDQTGKTPDLDLDNIQLQIQNDDKRHQLTLQFSLPGNTPQQMTLKADLTGDYGKPQDWSGRLYLKTSNLQLDKWTSSLPLPELAEHQLLLQGGSLAGNLWLNIEQSRVASVSGNLSLSMLTLSDETEPATTLDSIETDLLWSGQPDSWQLTLQNLAIRSGEYHTSQAHLALQHSPDNNHLALSRFNLSLPGSLLAMLNRLTPDVPAVNTAGTIKDLRAYWQNDGSTWFIQTDFENLSLLPEDNQIPGALNLTGSLLASETAGQVRLDSKDSIYNHTGLFRKPIPVKKLKGQVNWFRSDDTAWHIRSDYLQAITPHLSTSSRLSIDLDDNDTLLDIQTDFHDGDASHAWLYYPYSIMSPQLVSWLDRGIVSGHVTSGSFVLKGNASDFAYSKSHNGHFEILFNTENTILDYQEGWPRLEELAAQVRFHNNDLGIDVYSGKLFDTEILNARAEIDVLDKTSPVKIRGTTLGPAPDMLRMLGESPLKQDFGILQETLQIDGQSKVALDFAIPIEEEDEYRLDGQVTFMDNTLRLPEWDLETRNLKGKLHFDLDGIDAKQITAKLFDADTTVSIDHDASGNTLISADTHLPLSRLEAFTGKIPESLANGHSDWQVRLNVPPIRKGVAKPATLTVKSRLEGIAINAPEPLGKDAGSSKALSVTAGLKGSGNLPLIIDYNEQLFASMELETLANKQTRLTKAHLHFGPGKQTLLQPGIQLSGKLATLNVDEWLDWIKQLNLQTEKQSLPVQLDLVGQRVIMFGREFKDFSLYGRTQGQLMTGDVRSDKFNGHYEIVGQNPIQSVNLKLDNANLTLDLNALNDKPVDNAAQEVLNPADFPDLLISIDQLKLNDYPFGQLVFRTTHGKQSMRLDEFRINGENLRADASGIWINNSGEQKSQLDFTMDSKNFGEMLKQLGYSPQIAESDAAFDGSLSWPGGPHQFRQEVLSGKLNMDLIKGRLLEVNPGVGRVLGILNLGALQRRLALDFSDLFKEGFSFDEITATFNLDDGDAYTNDMLIRSTSGKIIVSGRTGLRSRDFDQLVTITPSLQSTLTIAGAIAGGPAGAAVAYLAQKVIGNEVDKIGRTQYTVTGDWVDPKITKLEKSEPAETGETANESAQRK